MKIKNYLFFLIFLALCRSQAMATNVSTYLVMRTLGLPTTLMRYDIPIAWKYENRWKNNTFIKSVLENLDKLNSEQSEDLYKNRELVRAHLFSKLSNRLKLEIDSHALRNEFSLDKDIQYTALFISLYTSMLKPMWESHPLRKFHQPYDDDEYANDFNTEETQLFRAYTMIHGQILKNSNWFQVAQKVKSPSYKNQGSEKEIVAEETVHIIHELSSLNKVASIEVVGDHYGIIYDYLLGRKSQGIVPQKKRNLRSSLSLVLTEKSAYPLLKIMDYVLGEKEEELAASL